MKKSTGMVILHVFIISITLTRGDLVDKKTIVYYIALSLCAALITILFYLLNDKITTTHALISILFLGPTIRFLLKKKILLKN